MRPRQVELPPVAVVPAVRPHFVYNPADSNNANTRVVAGGGGGGGGSSSTTVGATGGAGGTAATNASTGAGGPGMSSGDMNGVGGNGSGGSSSNVGIGGDTGGSDGSGSSGGPGGSFASVQFGGSGGAGALGGGGQGGPGNGRVGGGGGAGGSVGPSGSVFASTGATGGPGSANTAATAGGVGSVTITYTAALLPQVISFPQPPDIAVNAGPATMTATGGASGNPVTFTSNTTSTCTTSGTNNETIALLTTGTCSITANQTGNSTYATADPVTRTFQITAIPVPPAPTPQVIAFDQPANIKITSGTTTMTATGGDSGNPVIFSSNTTGVCTTGGTHGETVALLATGTCEIIANQAGDSTYAAADPVTRSFSIEPAGGGNDPVTPQVPLADCARLPSSKKLARPSRSRLLAPGCLSNAHQRVAAKVQLKRTSRGDIRPYQLRCRSGGRTSTPIAASYGDGYVICRKGALVLRINQRRLPITVTLFAPADSEFTEYLRRSARPG